ncbi:hypothetical protein N7475_003610 [Penicillium sp. IBT 31633x]|nr:hypothetical protein N7475_003610 [Penicillium sp. IBT 31633x]
MEDPKVGLPLSINVSCIHQVSYLMAIITFPGSPQSFGPVGLTSRGCRALLTTHNEVRISSVPSPTGFRANLTTPPLTPRRKSAIRARPFEAQQVVDQRTAYVKKTVRFDASPENTRFFLTADAPVASISGPYSTAWKAHAMGPFYNGPSQLGNEKFFCRSNRAFDAPSPSQTIRLQSLALCPSGHKIRGTVAVLNLAFEKEVSARFTFDKWKSISDVGAEHLQSLYLGPSIVSDLFSFMIDRKSLITSAAGNILHVCVRYRVLDHESWDKNGGMNYQVIWTA